MTSPVPSDPTNVAGLSPIQVSLVKASWKEIAPQSEEIARRFYANLFELDSTTRLLFEDTDMHAQGMKLMDIFTFVIKGLDQLEFLAPAIGDLGRNHLGYGVKTEHYALVEQALMEALRSELKESFTCETEEAWRITYDYLATIMKKGSIPES